MKASENICPACGNRNASTDTVCSLCGETLSGEGSTKAVAIPRILSQQTAEIAENTENLIDLTLVPEDGLGIYVMGKSKPFYIHMYKELLVGRMSEATLEAALNLSEMGADKLGVSRRHMKILRSVSGFEIVDLASTNGTWLNGQKLIPHKPYHLESGSIARIGNMDLLIVHHANK